MPSAECLGGGGPRGAGSRAEPAGLCAPARLGPTRDASPGAPQQAALAAEELKRNPRLFSMSAAGQRLGLGLGARPGPPRGAGAAEAPGDPACPARARPGPPGHRTRFSGEAAAQKEP